MNAYGKMLTVFKNKNTKTKMQKTKRQNQRHIFLFSKKGFSALAVVLVFSFSVVGFSLVNANTYQQQIDALNAQNNQKKSQQGVLSLEAGSLSQAIEVLEHEIAQKQAAINTYKAEVERLQAEIKKAEIELAKQKRILGETIKTMYLEGDISTLEMLATSKDLSDYFDKEQYRESVRSKVKNSVDKITQLKLDMNTNKEKTEKLIAEQEVLKSDLLAQNNEKNRLLSLNVNEQNKLDGEIRANQQRIAKLRAEAEAALARSLSSGSYKVASIGPVSGGEIIGSVGSTGMSTGAHLHLEARSGNGVVNPSPYIDHQPVNRPPAYISQGYGVANPWYKSGYHMGIDYAAPHGSPIYAVRGGHLYRGCSNQMLGTRNNDYGYVAIVEHSNGVRTIYAHMSGGPSACNYNTF